MIDYKQTSDFKEFKKKWDDSVKQCESLDNSMKSSQKEFLETLIGKNILTQYKNTIYVVKVGGVEDYEYIVPIGRRYSIELRGYDVESTLNDYDAVYFNCDDPLYILSDDEYQEFANIFNNINKNFIDALDKTKFKLVYELGDIQGRLIKNS